MQGLGEALFKQGQSEVSEFTWRQAIDVYKELGDHDKLGETYKSLSLLIWYSMRYSEAREICQQGLELFEGASDSIGYARLLTEAGRTYIITTHKDQGKFLCEQAINMAIRLGNLEVKLEATITLALIKNDDSEKIKIWEGVAGIAEANGLYRTAGRAYYNIGVTLAGDLTIRNSVLKSRDNYLLAVDFNQKIADIEGMLSILSIVYESYIELGELNTVEDKIYRIFGSSIVPKTRLDKLLNINRPVLMSAQGDWPSAKAASKVILKDFQDEGNIQKIVYRKVSIAYEILEQNRFGRCDDISEAESYLLESIDQDPSYIIPQFDLVIIYIRLGQLDDARDQLARAKRNVKMSRPGWVFDPISSIIELEFAFAEKRWEEAVSLCENQIGGYQFVGLRWEWARRLIDLGDALIGRNEPGDLERAQETYQQSLDMFTEMGAPGYIKVLEERLADL